MRISSGVAKWLRYYMEDPTTGAPVDGLTYAECETYYMMPGDATMSLQACSDDGFRNCGNGVYQVYWPSEFFAETGPFTSILYQKSDSTICSRREDEVTTDTDIATGCTIRINALDENSLGVPNAQIQLRDDTGATMLQQKTAGIGGYADFFVPTGKYNVYVWAVGYNWDYPELIEVTEATSYSIIGEAITPGVPEAPELCLVTGTLLDSEGNPRESITVSFELVRPSGSKPVRVTTTGQLVTRTTQTCTTDANGAFEISLIPNDSLTPTNTRYHVKVDDTVDETCTITVTEAGGTQDISDLL